MSSGAQRRSRDTMHMRPAVPPRPVPDTGRPRRPAIPERRAPPDADALLRELLVEVAAAGLTHIEAWQALRHHRISRSVLQRAWARAIVSGELRCVAPGVSSFGGRWAIEIRSKNADWEPES